MVARSSDSGEGRWSFPSLTSLPLDRTRVRLSGELAAVVNLLSCAPAPTVLLWRCAMGAHLPVERLSDPDQGMDQGPNWPLGQLVEIKLIFSPLISPYNLNLTYLLYLVLIPSQISAKSVPHRHGQLPLDLTATMHLSVLKQILN